MLRRNRFFRPKLHLIDGKRQTNLIRNRNMKRLISYALWHLNEIVPFRQYRFQLINLRVRSIVKGQQRVKASRADVRQRHINILPPTLLRTDSLDRRFGRHNPYLFCLVIIHRIIPV